MKEKEGVQITSPVFQEMCWALCYNLAFTLNAFLALTCWTLLCTGRQVKPRSSGVKTIDHWQSSTDSVTQQPAARINLLKTRLLEQLKQIKGFTCSETKTFGLNTIDAFKCKTQVLIKGVFAPHNDLQTR